MDVNAKRLVKRPLLAHVEKVYEEGNMAGLAGCGSVYLRGEAMTAAEMSTVAAHNKVRDDVRKEILLRLAPVVVPVLAVLVGL